MINQWRLILRRFRQFFQLMTILLCIDCFAFIELFTLISHKPERSIFGFRPHLNIDSSFPVGANHCRFRWIWLWKTNFHWLKMILPRRGYIASLHFNVKQRAINWKVRNYWGNHWPILDNFSNSWRRFMITVWLVLNCLLSLVQFVWHFPKLWLPESQYWQKLVEIEQAIIDMSGHLKHNLCSQNKHFFPLSILKNTIRFHAACRI